MSISLLIVVIGLVLGIVISSRRWRGWGHLMTYLMTLVILDWGLGISWDQAVQPWSALHDTSGYPILGAIAFALGEVVLLVVWTEATWWLYVGLRALYRLVPSASENPGADDADK